MAQCSHVFIGKRDKGGLISCCSNNFISNTAKIWRQPGVRLMSSFMEIHKICSGLSSSPEIHFFATWALISTKLLDIWSITSDFVKILFNWNKGGNAGGYSNRNEDEGAKGNQSRPIPEMNVQT